MTTDELIMAYKEGSDAAFTKLYQRYDPVVKAHLNQLVKHEKHEIDDISQEIWITVAKYVKESFKFESLFTTYLYRIIRTRFANYVRSRKYHMLNDHEYDMLEQVLYGKTGEFEDSGQRSVASIMNSLDFITHDFQTTNAQEQADILQAIIMEEVAKLPYEQQVIFLYKERYGYGGLQKAADYLGVNAATLRSRNRTSKFYPQTLEKIEERFNEQFQDHNRNY